MVVDHAHQLFTYPNKFLVAVGHRGSDNRGSTVVQKDKTAHAYTNKLHVVEMCSILVQVHTSMQST